MKKNMNSILNYQVWAIGALIVIIGCRHNEGPARELAQKEYLGYVDTRVGTAASIADITVTEVEEPMGYV